ncbi:MAG TPA: malto-oligosyltrehalose synthase [Kofleriaceae bacterium]|nr:malto-oligosyltrehalose synthase [Kofleriaceae bacterium]
MTATYRLQLHAGFTFADARAIVPYLAELGISHLYLSPILQAAEGSSHGYDVVDAERVSAQLGGEDGFAALVDAARAHGLAILLDIVPNHMSIAGTGNRWWLDVLENGPASYYAHYFDVDWPVGDERITLPVLGERYGRALAGGALAIAHDGAGGFAVRARELALPIAPRSLGTIVRRAAERGAHAELAFIGDALAELPRDLRPEARRRRHRDKAVVTRRLRELCADRACAMLLDAEVAAVNADKVALDAILEAQAYRLVHWTVSGSQLPYRRFFDINSLVGLHTEQLDVFEACHARILAWLADGSIAGVRVDHVDGLREPGAYLARLRAAAPDAWIVVEKILAPGEQLPAWPIDGTTGYDFADRVGGLLVDPAGEAALTRTFEAYTDTAFEPGAARRAARLEVMSDALHSELSHLVTLAERACGASPTCRDFTRAEIEHALREIVAGYPVYRTYLDGQPSATDRARIAEACRAATGVDPDLLEFLERALAGELGNAAALELARSAQQITGAIVAKGDEDTLAYRLVRLASRCEVGADLATFAIAPAEVHRALAAGAPRTLLATSTHDSKRGEDVRARIAVLSERPAAWADAVVGWRGRAERHWGEIAPDRVIEYLLWQSLVGAWPIDAERVTAYARKAAREARLRTSWRTPDAAYEAALARWVAGVLGDRDLVAELAAFAAALAPRGDANALAQLLVKLTAPGVPDFYQGCERQARTLVDPDNRRPIDLAAAPDELGEMKLALVRRVLALRRDRPELFAGTYTPLCAVGPRAERVFAFARGDALITVVSRLGPPDRETALDVPAGTWRDVLADRALGGRVAAAALAPVALLVRA